MAEFEHAFRQLTPQISRGAAAQHLTLQIQVTVGHLNAVCRVQSILQPLVLSHLAKVKIT